MSTPFTNRRKPRKIGQDDQDDSGSTDQDIEPIVKRPTNTRPKLKSKLRLSFGPGETSMLDDGESDSGVITPKRHGLGRRALEKSTLQRAWTPPRSSEQLPLRVGKDQDRPTYSADYLKELRDSTPSTPKTLTDDDREKSVDVAAKFGELAPLAAPSAIPSEAEIREKKARRARLAKEQDYISLETVGGEADYLDLETGEPAPDTRLVRDDEDFAEGFDEYVEDGKISLGRKAEREQKRKEREQMRELIDEAAAVSDEDDSDIEEKAAYEAAQTRKAIGNGGPERIDRPRTPPKVTSLPRLAHSLERLRLTLAVTEKSRAQLLSRMEELRKEKADIAVREVEIQALIKEAGDNYERLRKEAGLGPGSGDESSAGGDLQVSRGLESFGASLAPSTAGSGEED